VSQWVRVLSRVTGASAEWHVPRTKSFTTTTYCRKELAGTLEVASDDKAERGERCSACMTHLAPTQAIAPQRASRPMEQARSTPAKRAAAKKIAAKMTVRKTSRVVRSGKAPVAKAPARRPRRGRA
jgi:hypothetical protein